MQQRYVSYLCTLQNESSCRCNSWLRRLCVLNAPISSFIVLMMYLQHPQFRPRCTCVSQQQGYMTSSNLCTRNQGHKRRHPVQLCIVSTTVRRDARTVRQPATSGSHANTVTPISMPAIATIFSGIWMGITSPYPTVAMVLMAQYVAVMYLHARQLTKESAEEFQVEIKAHQPQMSNFVEV